MKRPLLITLLLSSFVALAQPNLKYSGFWDSYYTTGPLKYYAAPGMTMMQGELEKSNMSFGIELGMNYRVAPPVYINGSIRYMNMRGNDHDDKRLLAYSGNYLQFNAIGNYHIIYDLVRDSWHRRRGRKKFNLYLSTGLSMMIFYSTTPNKVGVNYSTVSTSEKVLITNIFSKTWQVIQLPLGIGLPIRVTDRFTITPEIMQYKAIFTDKIDGIENTLIRPGSKRLAKDYYSFVNVKLMFNPKGKKRKRKLYLTPSQGGGGGGGGSYDDFDDDEPEDIDEDVEDDLEPDNSEPEPEEEEIEEETEEDDGFMKEEDEEDWGGEPDNY